MLIKTPVVCLMFVVYMLWFYYRKPHIPIKSTRIFQLLTGAAFVNVLFDLITIYLEAKLTFSKGIRVMQSLPFFLSAIGILVLPITYVHGKTTDYSLGPKAYALYGSIVVYLILKDIHREIKQCHQNAYRIGENVNIATKLLWGEETDNKYKCMQNIIAFCTEIGQRFAYTDYLTHIYNRNAFERVMYLRAILLKWIMK